MHFRRLEDDRVVTVSGGSQALVSKRDARPLVSEPVADVSLAWKAEPGERPGLSWFGVWTNGGALKAVPRTIYLKQVGVKEAHFHAGASNIFPGLVELQSESAIRVRYRIQRPLNLGIFVSTHH